MRARSTECVRLGYRSRVRCAKDAAVGCLDSALAGLARSLTRLAIWLILPVVICLSQRLSHACLSTNFYTVKPRMAH